MHSLSGGRLAAFEQGLDLSLRARETGVEGLRLPSLLSSEDRGIGFCRRRGLRAPESLSELMNRPLLMAMEETERAPVRPTPLKTVPRVPWRERPVNRPLIPNPSYD